MTFSILIANFNNSLYILEAVNSALSQTYSNLEILILDDASTDSSVSVIRSLSELDSRIKVYFHERNMGIGYTKRKLIELSNGSLYGFLDPDDYLSSYAVQVMVDAHKCKPNTGLIYSSLYHVDENGKINSKSRYNREIPFGQTFLNFGGISHFVSMKRNFYNLTDGINPLLRIAEDQDLYMKMEEVAPVHFIDKPLYYYRSHVGAISLNRNVVRAHVWQVIAIYEAYRRRGIEIDEGKLISYFEKREAKFLEFQKEILRPSKVFKLFLKSLKHWIRYTFR